MFPYLLRGLSTNRPNQVYAMDITYIPMARGFVYLVAVLDWFSRKVLSWWVSITMDVHFCLDALEEAIAKHSTPEIVNTDQGSQFTSQAFTGLLKQHGPTFRGSLRTNAIESLNSVIRKAIKKRKLFPTDDSAKKAIYLSIQGAANRWTMPIRNWKLTLNRFMIEFEDRLVDYV